MEVNIYAPKSNHHERNDFNCYKNMDLEMAEAMDFYKEIDSETRARAFSETIGVELERAKIIFWDLFLYTHGIAVLTAAGKIPN